MCLPPPSAANVIEDQRMVAFAEDRTGWTVARGRHLAARVGQLELLDRAYTLAAQTFVTLLPLILALAAAVASPGSNIVAQEFIKRFGLVGAAAKSVQDLIVVRTEGIYWIGLAMTLYAAFTLSKRASRAYNAVWGTPQLPIRDQWRSLVWILVQLVLVVMVTELRGFARESGPVLAAMAAVFIVVVWAGAEVLTQTLLTRGNVARGRILLAAVFATTGRLGIVVWSALFLTRSMVRQAEAYGPIGVVFALFSGLLVYWVVLLGSTLLAAVLTDPDVGAGPESIGVDIDVAQGDF
jgi:membrane protein